LSADFVDAARSRGFSLWAGVPCSYLTGFLNRVAGDERLDYVAAANEGDAVALAAGAGLAGRRAVAMFQNSGLGNAVNPLTSLVHPHRMPLLLIVSLRGDPEGAPDEPQHALMGATTTRMLELMDVRWEYFPRSSAEAGAALARAVEHMEGTGLAYCFVVRKDAVGSGAPPAALPQMSVAASGSGALMAASASRREYLAALQAAAGARDIFVSTTGYTSRELYALADRPSQLYLVGAMGCASSVGLGLAIARPDLRVTVLDGDGAALMRLGAMATIGYRRPPNLLHIVLDNRMHESTGGQPTVTASIDLAAIARACGYPHVHTVGTPRQLVEHFSTGGKALGFVSASVKPGVGELPRPKIGPAEVAGRLRAHLAQLAP
jgi:phosphonopyruvate decarboxylase